MSTPGYVFRDGGPIPDAELEESAREHGSATDTPSTQAGQPTPKSTSNSSLNAPQAPTKAEATYEDAPTDSHALAEAAHEEKGAVQEHGYHDGEVRDLGWNEHPKDVPKPLVGGLPNDELWLLVRRFNKQMYHVKSLEHPPMSALDLEIADEDEFSPDKLRANLERLYMTVIVGMTAFAKHIARLRSWREPRRTGAFFAAYIIAWAFDLLIPLLFTTLIVLVAFPPARSLMFPPAPIALVSTKTGGVQSPKAGVLGSHDSITGAPEKHQGEAVEQEASNFVAGIATVALSSATGKHEPGDPGNDPVGKDVPDPTNIVTAASDAQSSAAGGIPPTKHDKTKQPMEDAMWATMRPFMHIIGDVADGWERFANALSPTAPFPKQTPRLKLASLLVPAVLVAAFTTSYMFMKMTMLFTGLGFFGDPVVWRAIDLLNTKFPNWQKLLELRNTILKGVPTNAQLTITLLRIGEANKAPIPPPPRSDEPPPSHPASLNEEELTLDTNNEELQDAITADETPSSPDSTAKPKKKTGARILNMLKGTTKAGVETKLGADTVRAKVGSKHAQNHLGVIPKGDQIASGPVDFKARYKGHKGWVYVNTSATIPCVSFSSHQSDGTGMQSTEDLKPVWSIAIEEITSIKKVGGFGWKAKLVVGWATNNNVLDGLELEDSKGDTYRITAIALREELFNRLVSMGRQKWESY